MVGNQRLMTEATALRRRFLVDMAWPVASDLLCHMFGLIDTSSDVRDAEQAESDQRMSRLGDDEEAMSVVVSASQDAAAIMALITEPDERAAWLATFALAVINLLEDQGKVEVAV